MDFERVFKNIIKAFKDNDVRYGLIGGYALGLYGVVRSTADLDFLIDKKKERILKRLMGNNLYEIVHETDNLIQFEHPTAIMGSIDFLYAFREPSLAMLERAVIKGIFPEKIPVKVLLPEDLIGLKVQAMHNDAKRIAFDMADIRSLMEINAQAMDWGIIEKHFALFNDAGLLKKLKNEYKKK